MRIYIGDIKNLCIKQQVISEDKRSEIVTESIIVRRNAPFYYNFVGVPVSLEYNTFLPTYNEAQQYIKDCFNDNPLSVGGKSCLYVNYDTMTPREISKKEFKQLKKAYQKQKQKNR